MLIVTQHSRPSRGRLRGFTHGVLLDRDGCINALVPRPSGPMESPLSRADVRLEPRAAQAMRQLRTDGFGLAIVSNQPAAAKQETGLATLIGIHERVLSLLAQAEAAPDVSFICLHHPHGRVSALAKLCRCRKPGPALLIAAMEWLDAAPTNCWMIGDADSDLYAAQRAGCGMIRLENPASARRRRSDGLKVPCVDNLHAAAAEIRREAQIR
jgi:D-glycero-D-manno-heptose 1,7-bisphosphate phosphatase